MDIFEINQTLKNMIIYVDTREQPTARAKERYERFGCPYERKKLDFGDYSVNATLPDGSLVWTDKPFCVIERKMNLNELSACFTHERKRFKAEFERAKAAGANVYLIIENSNWENLLNGKYGTKYNAEAFTASLLAWMVRYNIKPIFCKSETSGKLIKNILYRELKEYLEKGAIENG